MNYIGDHGLEQVKILWERKDVDHFRRYKNRKSVMEEAKLCAAKKVVAFLMSVDFEKKQLDADKK